MNKAEEHLISHGIKPSAVRLLVWKSIRDRSETFSLGDIERDLMPMDKSSIFRALRLSPHTRCCMRLTTGQGRRNTVSAAAPALTIQTIYTSHSHAAGRHTAWRISPSRLSVCQRVSPLTIRSMSSKACALNAILAHRIPLKS